MHNQLFPQCRWLFILIFISALLTGCSSKKPSNTTRSTGTFNGKVYVVKKGDTLSKISRMTGSSVGELARQNNISAPYTISVGQRISIPGKRNQRVATKTVSSTQRSSTKSIAKSAAPVKDRCWLWPTQGSVITPFSARDGGNKGLDIAGNRGQAIYAAAPGTVVYVGNQLRGYGNLVMIKHDDNYITAYAHNETMLVKNGDKVKAKQKIATMGSSGAASVRLHFQIRYRATAIDPARYLSWTCSG